MSTPKISGKNLKTIVITSDLSGCYQARVRIPLTACEKLGLSWYPICYLPGEVGVDKIKTLINIVAQFDFVIVQRTYIKQLVEIVRAACDFVGVPMIYETDDDYLSLIPSNPCYFALADQGMYEKFKHLRDEVARLSSQGQPYQEQMDEANSMVPGLLYSRAKGEQDFKDILRMADAVTVSTEELARTIRPYNRNVVVFENCVERITPWRHCVDEGACVVHSPEGQPIVQIPERHGLFTVPNHAFLKRDGNKTELVRTPIIGYTCTPSHLGEDYNTIIDPLNRALDKLDWRYWLFLQGDASCGGQFSAPISSGRKVTTPASPYDLYLINLVNIQIGLCPLAPTIFNMSKSDIKAVEYGSVGAVPLVPNYVTYTRHWVDGENCLVYKDQAEFEEKLVRLCKENTLRERLAKNALRYVAENRLSSQQAAARMEFYRSVVEDSVRLETIVDDTSNK